MWKTKLITLYCTVCQYYDSKLITIAQRLSNNFQPQFTDEEVITIYLWGIMQRRFEVRSIYNYVDSHLRDWFPKLPSYQAFNNRLNRLSPALELFAEALIAMMEETIDLGVHQIMDSMPITVAKSSRSGVARVAPELCSKGYCSSKKEYFYGVKLHMRGYCRSNTIPFPAQLQISSGNAYDLDVARSMLQNAENSVIFADKAYCDSNWASSLLEHQNIELVTPVKKKKGQISLDAADEIFSTAVSRIRQPIESFFNWLSEKTGIHCASKVRSAKGLLVHVFGRVTAALLVLIDKFYP